MAPPEARRLTGPNRFADGPGAVLDLALPAGIDVEGALEAWRAESAALLAGLGWPAGDLASRVGAGCLSLFVPAPPDGLYAAVELIEQAWSAAEARLRGGRPDGDRAALIARLEASRTAEARPRLVALGEAAAARGLSCIVDPEALSLGLGAGSRSWEIDRLPDPSEVDWRSLREVPVALVTGTNGKSTTVRLVAAMASAAGMSVATASSDGVRVGEAALAAGDYSGPEGARLALRDRRTEIAVLETARGGLLRRGLAMPRADVAAITNLAEDHLDAQIPDLEALAEVKLIVARVARTLVLNADDPLLVRCGIALRRPADRLSWFGLDPARPPIPEHTAAGGTGAVLSDGWFLLRRANSGRRILPAAEAPVTLGGRARHNLANALAAIGIAAGLGLPLAAMRAGLRTFANTPEANPGRLNLFEPGGVTVLVDYAHNPQGLRALVDFARGLPAARRLIAIGQAGDRDDAAIRALATEALAFGPDRVIVKELPSHLRGRKPGELPALLAAALRAERGTSLELDEAQDDLDATRRALAWARPGDLLVLPVHARRAEVIGLLRSLVDRGWRAGEGLEA